MKLLQLFCGHFNSQQKDNYYEKIMKRYKVDTHYTYNNNE